jgi:hypothetical protein
MLYEVNNSAQIPLDKRIDVALKPPANSKDPVLPIDKAYASQKEAALKRLEQLLTDVPHTSYSAAKTAKLPSVEDLVTGEDDAKPVSFLAADDVDDYIYALDRSIDNNNNNNNNEVHIPTLAPAAHQTATSSLNNAHLKNPTSVTNWLRKHAPKIFLQDGEAHGDEGDGGGEAAGHTGGTSGRKSRGGRGERGGKASTRGKRASTSSRVAADRGDWDGSMDEDVDYGTPLGRGKRKRDDDGGYRPGGSSSRPSKKKRKSEGEVTASGRKSKKDVAVKEE